MSRSNHLWYRYGLDEETYLAMLESQNGLCAACRAAPTIVNGVQRPLSVDHDHATGENRGLLCDSCNLILGTLATLQGSYQHFQQAVKDIDSGKPLTGAASVVGLFNAIGISATPLAGKGFRINENTVREHTDARGLDQKALQKLEGLQTGAVITESQLKDYAGIAAQVYRDSFINAANEQRRQLGYIDVLPLGNNEPVDAMTAGSYLKIAGGDRAKAEAALKKSGWVAETDGFAFVPDAQRDTADKVLPVAHLILLDSIDLQQEFFKIEELEPLMQNCMSDYSAIVRS